MNKQKNVYTTMENKYCKEGKKNTIPQTVVTFEP